MGERGENCSRASRSQAGSQVGRAGRPSSRIPHSGALPGKPPCRLRPLGNCQLLWIGCPVLPPFPPKDNSAPTQPGWSGRRVAGQSEGTGRSRWNLVAKSGWSLLGQGEDLAGRAGAGERARPSQCPRATKRVRQGPAQTPLGSCQGQRIVALTVTVTEGWRAGVAEYCSAVRSASPRRESW